MDFPQGFTFGFGLPLDFTEKYYHWLLQQGLTVGFYGWVLPLDFRDGFYRWVWLYHWDLPLGFTAWFYRRILPMGFSIPHGNTSILGSVRFRGLRRWVRVSYRDDGSMTFLLLPRGRRMITGIVARGRRGRF